MLFLYQHELANINKEPTCYKNSENPSCIDFILSNRPKSFVKTNAIFTGFSDFHKLVLSVFKTAFPKSKPKEIIYRNLHNYMKFPPSIRYNTKIITTSKETESENMTKFFIVLLDLQLSRT